MPFYPISLSQSEVFKNSGIHLLLKLGAIVNRMTPECFPYNDNDDDSDNDNDNEKRMAMLAEVKKRIENIINYYEKDATGRASPLKPFLTEYSSASISIPKTIIISLMSYRLIHSGDIAIPINVIITICSSICPNKVFTLEYRRIIGVMCVDGLLEVNDEDDCGIVPFIRLSDKCVIKIFGGNCCLPIIDTQTIENLKAEKSIKQYKILKSRLKIEYH